MKHFWLKFNHGVEIGARLAYIGHFKRTGEAGIHHIIQEERGHQEDLETVLAENGSAPNYFIDLAFVIIGSTIQFLCKFMPLWSLDFVAKLMEHFAVYNYRKLGKLYPEYGQMWEDMAAAEERHAVYFSKAP